MKLPFKKKQPKYTEEQLREQQRQYEEDLRNALMENAEMFGFEINDKLDLVIPEKPKKQIVKEEEIIELPSGRPTPYLEKQEEQNVEDQKLQILIKAIETMTVSNEEDMTAELLKETMTNLEGDQIGTYHTVKYLYNKAYLKTGSEEFLRFIEMMENAIVDRYRNARNTEQVIKYNDGNALKKLIRQVDAKVGK